MKQLNLKPVYFIKHSHIAILINKAMTFSIAKFFPFRANKHVCLNMDCVCSIDDWLCVPISDNR